MSRETMTNEEINRRVASVVMARKLVPESLPDIRIYKDKDGRAWLSQDIDFSGTGNGMLLVLEAMRERGHALQVTELEKGYGVSFGAAEAVDESLPRAVCLAAIAACECEQPAKAEGEQTDGK